MSLEKKYISKENWKRLLEKEFVYKQIKYKELEGEAALIKIKKVKEPLFKQYDEKIIKLADDGYYWLQLGLKNKNYWVTAMYDANEEIIQYYIDMTKENKINTDGRSYFYDLFLDVVQLANGKIYLLDEDELINALKEHIIDKSDFDLAHAEANKIIELLQKNNFEPIKMCKFYLKELSKNLENCCEVL